MPNIIKIVEERLGNTFRDVIGAKWTELSFFGLRKWYPSLWAPDKLGPKNMMHLQRDWMWSCEEWVSHKFIAPYHTHCPMSSKPSTPPKWNLLNAASFDLPPKPMWPTILCVLSLWTIKPCKFLWTTEMKCATNGQKLVSGEGLLKTSRKRQFPKMETFFVIRLETQGKT